ncbi:hypothetical protein Tco_0751486 [Tanacetum coccineum]|uniref:Uncharacterized protein n=1 Tax=Tanacetum coccineum TaxID=301880 RepID=A0ABQ4Z4C4_9ASTR
MEKETATRNRKCWRSGFRMKMNEEIDSLSFRQTLRIIVRRVTIQAAFRAHEIRRIPPTPQDEMRAGMSRATSIKQSGRVFLNSYGS